MNTKTNSCEPDIFFTPLPFDLCSFYHTARVPRGYVDIFRVFSLKKLPLSSRYPPLTATFCRIVLAGPYFQNCRQRFSVGYPGPASREGAVPT
jgi:hypothetical protein